jgi:predicted dehydrogenase
MTVTPREVAVAVVGLGFGRNHARVFHELQGVRLAAICDRDQERLAEVARGRNLKTYTDHLEMLEQERLDAVIVAVPTRLHAVVAGDAIAAGCAVMVEKPIASTLDEGRRLVEQAEAARVPLMHGHIERFNPAVQELKRRLDAGEAGRIIQVTTRRLAYFVDRPRDFDVGVVHDLAFHDIDVMRLLTGAEVERLYAETLTGIRTPFEDSLNGTLRFHGEEPGSGVIGTLEVNRLSARVVRELSVLGTGGEFVLDYRAQSLEFRPAQALRADTASKQEGPIVRLQGDDPHAPIAIEVQHHEPLLAELSAFVDAVRAGGPMPVSNRDALAALEIADALTESGRSGRAVTL